MEVKKPAKCNADEINPFTFEPPFTTCDKIMVRVIFKIFILCGGGGGGVVNNQLVINPA